MTILEQIIAQGDEILLSEIMRAILQRYEQLRPDWQIHVLAVEKSGNRNEQIERTIQLMEYMKESEV